MISARDKTHGYILILPVSLTIPHANRHIMLRVLFLGGRNATPLLPDDVAVNTLSGTFA